MSLMEEQSHLAIMNTTLHWYVTFRLTFCSCLLAVNERNVQFNQSGIDKFRY